LKHFLALLSLSYLGTALCVWWLSGFVPWFLLPDFPFLAIVFAGLFVPGVTGFLCALPAAIFREITTSAAPWSVFLGSLALYFVSREVGRRFLLRGEPQLLAAVVSLLLAESLSFVLLLSLGGARPFSILWGAQEAVRIAWTSLVSIPIFLELSSRWRGVRE
jgi:cell shape-determining protein MreD